MLSGWIGSDGLGLNVVAWMSFTERRQKLVKVLRKMYRLQKPDIFPMRRSRCSLELTIYDLKLWIAVDHRSVFR
jgi:hypothetical protein